MTAEQRGVEQQTTPQERGLFYSIEILASCHLIADTTNFYFKSMTETETKSYLEAEMHKTEC